MKSSELKKYLTLRPGVTSDQYGYAQVCNEYKHLVVKDKVVLDLGGNIGAFAVYAALEGCKQVITYEPDEENFKALEVNRKTFPQIISHRAAVVSDPETTNVSFFLTNGDARDGFSLISYKGRREVIVPARCLAREIVHYRPDCIKMDVEGAEYDLVANTIFPDCVKEIVMEIHFGKRAWRGQPYTNLVDKFKDWEVIIQPKQTGTNFHTLGHWRRK